MPETPPKSNNPFDDLVDDKSPNQLSNDLLGLDLNAVEPEKKAPQMPMSPQSLALMQSGKQALAQLKQVSLEVPKKGAKPEEPKN